MGVHWTPQGPFDALATNVTWGLMPGSYMSDSGGYVRRQHANSHLNRPSLAWQAASLADPDLSGNPFAERWLNYYHPGGIFPWHSYATALNMPPEAGMAAFSNKVVFIGQHESLSIHKTIPDVFRTPYCHWGHPLMHGVEINVTAFLNILRNEPLSRTSDRDEVVAILGCGLLLGCGLAGLRPRWATGAGIAFFFCLWADSYLLAWNTTSHLWFPWLIVGGVQMPVALGWSVLTHTRRLEQTEKDQQDRIEDLENSASRGAVAVRPAGFILTLTRKERPTCRRVAGAPHPDPLPWGEGTACHPVVKGSGQQPLSTERTGRPLPPGEGWGEGPLIGCDVRWSPGVCGRLSS